MPTMQSSGPISIGQVRDLFGLGNPIDAENLDCSRLAGVGQGQKYAWSYWYGKTHTPAGTLIDQYCVGTALYGTYASGDDATTYTSLIDPLSTTCGAIPVPADGLNLTHVSSPHWSGWLNARAVIFTTTTFAAQYWNRYVGFSWIVTLPQSGTYTLEWQCDDSAEFWLDSTLVGTCPDNFNTGSPATVQFAANAGQHAFTMGVLNHAGAGDSWSNNPCGVGFIVLNPDGSVFLDSSSLQIVNPAIANGYVLEDFSDGSVVGVRTP